MVGQEKQLYSVYIEKYFSEERVCSIGREKYVKKLIVKDRDIKLDIWPLPEQEKYNQVNIILIKNTQIALFVYDKTYKHSFEYLYRSINPIKK